MKKTIVVLGFALAFAAVSFGSPSFCSGAAPGTDLNTLNTAGGCTQDDVLFSTFQVQDNGTAFVPPVATGDVSMYATGANPTVTALFDTPGTAGAPTWTVNVSNGQMDSRLSYTATTTGLFTGLAMPFDTSNYTGSGTVLQITETYCLGQADINNCDPANYGQIQVQVAADGTTITNNGPATFAPLYNIVGIQDEVFMQNGFTLLTLANEFDEQFADTPEPTTFVLMGSALAGLAFLRHRRRSAV